MDRDKRRRYTRCSFCGKGQDQVRKLVAGPGVYICDQCVELCNEVLEEDRRIGPPAHKRARDTGSGAERQDQPGWRATTTSRPRLWDRLRRRIWHLIPAYR